MADRKSYPPEAWTRDRERCRTAKIPDGRGSPTKGELAKAIVTRCPAAGPPAEWVTADGVYGQERKFHWAGAKLSAIGFLDGDAPTRHRRALARRSPTRPEEIACYFACAPVTCTVADPARPAATAV
ncbi:MULTISPECIES: transposase [Streptomyces]|uniref:Transposase n=1 Tax=Streptomyces fimbriatus TaxID=68197 RepID=A0ABW0D1V4_STRFI